MNKLIIEVRPNEYAMRDENPHVPWTPEEIARDVAACAEAGASLAHFHARTPAGGAAHDAETYAEIMREIRARCDILLGPVLANSPGASPRQRLANVVDNLSDPATTADVLAVDTGCVNMDRYDRVAKRFESKDRSFVNDIATIEFLLDQARALGIKPGLASFNVSWLRTIEAFLDMGALAEPALVEIVLGGDEFIAAHPGTVAGLEAQLAFLPANRRVEWGVLTHGGSVLDVAATAIRRGGHIAVGLGDHPYAELGCPTNADLVRHVVELARSLGREVADVAEARQILGIAR
ncbi:3-keto-5-aminohexanoate cleavage protein [Micromonospora sp. NBC_00898]|uniref:3-keto-5-aminohexanoate cleavage protein n=1 Tax=Micromonospora sp. NBC_00898 TaxID=2975981 RepID=UPI00386C2621|nr:3-keto-5-aminohexanoate cleavage protein [Micromonospora sp. NBC_00898]